MVTVGQFPLGDQRQVCSGNFGAKDRPSDIRRWFDELLLDGGLRASLSENGVRIMLSTQ